MDLIQISEKPVFWYPKNNEIIKNQFARCVSAEIEVAGIRRYDDGGTDTRSKIYEEFYDLCKKWGVNVVRDGSLPSTGFEINTAPAGGDLFVKQITEICQFLHKNNSYVDRSCGLHIHFEARDYNYENMFKYVALWSKIEDTIFSLVTPSRKTGTYCKPLAQNFLNALSGHDFSKKPTSAQVAEFIKSVYYEDRGAGGVDRIRNSRRPSSRYHSINLHSWFYRGTVENRMHHGTIDATKIINWSILNVSLLEACKNMSERDINSISEEDSLAFLCGIAPDIKDWIIERYKLFRRDSNGKKYYNMDIPVEASEI